MNSKNAKLILCTIGKMVYPKHLKEHHQDLQTYAALAQHLQCSYPEIEQ